MRYEPDVGARLYFGESCMRGVHRGTEAQTVHGPATVAHLKPLGGEWSACAYNFFFGALSF